MPNTSKKGEIFGHPRGLYVLFFTELWERFSFYGMKTLLLLYMLNHFLWSQEDASSLLGTYSALAYGVPVIGGFIADRWLGAKRAVILGGVLLSAGHLLMVFEPLPYFYAALGLIILGVGFLKPNISTQVGSLYKPDDPRRDGAFTIFYMGINLGALMGPLLCDWLRVNYGYHYGFAAAGVGMILGLIVYSIGQKKLVEFNQEVADDEPDESGGPKADIKAQPKPEHPPHVVRDRVIVLLVVFAFVILFWTAFEQSPNVMLVWADKHTNLHLASTEPPPITLEVGGEPAAEAAGWFSDPRVTSGQTQSFNPFFIITMAPLLAFVWVWLDRRKLQPSTPTKMVLGLALVALTFGIMWPAAQLENRASSAPLGVMPAGLDVDEEGFIYNLEADGDPGQRTYYGVHRLRYDGTEQMLRLNGVLPDLDRLRLLALTAPKDFVAEVERIAAQTAEKPTETLTAQIDSAPSGLGAVEIKEGEGASRTTVLTWDPETKVLTALSEIKQRARIELLAAAAEPDFKRAVDKVYLDSSQFRVSVWWLIAFYLVLTMGELCLSPVGLSLVTKLAPRTHVGLCMGGWFLATAVAEKLAQVFGAMWGTMAPAKYFMIFVVMCGAGALLMALLIRPMKRMMHGVH